MALLVTAAFTVSRAREETIRRIELQGPSVKRWGGGILILVGAWLIVLAVFPGFFSSLFPV